MAHRVALLALIFLFFQGCDSAPTVTSTTAEIAGKVYTLELALTRNSRERGLMDRKVLSDDDGMLFVFPDAAERSFWMKNCYIDIDLLFLDSRGTVMSLHKMVFETPKARASLHGCTSAVLNTIGQMDPHALQLNYQLVL